MRLRPDRKSQRSTDEDSALRRLNRETTSVTVSYAMGDDQVTRVGRGPNMDARVQDANAQLPPGTWTRVAVSTPASVYAEIAGRPRDARSSHRNNDQGLPVYPKYENKAVQA